MSLLLTQGNQRIQSGLPHQDFRRSTGTPLYEVSLTPLAHDESHPREIAQTIGESPSSLSLFYFRCTLSMAGFVTTVIACQVKLVVFVFALTLAPTIGREHEGFHRRNGYLPTGRGFLSSILQKEGYRSIQRLV